MVCITERKKQGNLGEYLELSEIKQNISLHINNIYDEGELERIATVKDYLTVQKEGKRIVNRHGDDGYHLQGISA